MNLSDINDRVGEAYREAVRDLKRCNRGAPFVRSAHRRLVAGDGEGNRIGDPIYFSGPVRMKDVKALMAKPGVREVRAQGEVRAYERIDDLDWVGEEVWHVGVWSHQQATIAISAAAYRAELDALWAANTAFKNLDDCLNAGGNYRPSLDMRQPVMVRLANDYDAAQAARGDERRAYRYGA